MGWKSLDELDLDGRTVLTRVDLNVPVKDGRVTDRTRITRIRPTVDTIAEADGKVVLLAHFGRPKGARREEYSLGQVRAALAEELGRDVAFAEDCVGEPAEAAVAQMAPGDVLLLENTRFHKGEEANDRDFADRLAGLGDVYVNDAFSAAHRAHASTEGLARRLPAAAGRLMAEELGALERALERPERPLVAIVGGAKVSTKIDLLKNLVGRVDHLVIGGGMANTFLAARGHEIGTSLAEREMTGTAREIEAAAESAGCQIVLPVDAMVAEALEEGVEPDLVPITACPPGRMILDFGPMSAAQVGLLLGSGRTLVWNGPVGAFEVSPFDAATTAIANAAAERTREGDLVSVAGGGDTVAALNAAGVADDFTYVSSAGGAFLEWLEGKTLPGVAALHAAQ